MYKKGWETQQFAVASFFVELFKNNTPTIHHIRTTLTVFAVFAKLICKW